VGLARARRDWSIALVGPIGPGDPSTDVSPLRAEPNIHLLGKRPYEQLPDVLRGADAALIPYARNELTASIFPMKVYEYLAAGLPVVAAPLPSLEGVEGIDTAARSRLAAKHSWDVRMEEIAIALEAHG
jgi:glycosyltransferase involved in cell wall biosynthesis